MVSDYNRKDAFYKRAKEEGYRSRAAYKLKEIDSKYGLLKSGYRVLDLGAWPGGWMQVAAERVGSSGRVVGIDLVQIEDFGSDNIKVIVGDARDDVNLDAARSFAGGDFNLVLSDMSPKLTGIREVDSAQTVGCAELALFIARRVLIKQGNLVMKVFKSNETEVFVKSLRPLFNKVVRSELDSTRKTSNEFYLIALGYVGA